LRQDAAVEVVKLIFKYMSDNINKWVARYEISSSGKKASYGREPGLSIGGKFETEEEAISEFKEGLNEHVTIIISCIQSLANNKALKIRLRKYKCEDALNILLQLEQMIKSLPEL
jgi:hypothetical protein